MRLYKTETDEILDLPLIKIDDAYMYVDRLTADKLLKAGYKTVVEGEYPSEIQAHQRVTQKVTQTKYEYKIEYVVEDMPIEELKQTKLDELNLWAKNMTDKSKIDLKGFGVIDGGYKYLLNARALKNNFNLLPQKLFRMWDNSFKEVTLQDIETIERAIELAGIKLHAMKWSYEEAIANSGSKDELEAISFNDTIEVDLGAGNG